jgi:hypothetical protein
MVNFGKTDPIWVNYGLIGEELEKNTYLFLISPRKIVTNPDKVNIHLHARSGEVFVKILGRKNRCQFPRVGNGFQGITRGVLSQIKLIGS